MDSKIMNGGNSSVLIGYHDPTPKITEYQKRIAEAEKFFNLIFGGIKGDYFGYLWTTDKTTYPFAVSNPDERIAMAKKAIALNDQGRDVYFGVNLVASELAPNERAKNETVALQTATICDIDIRSQAHKKSNPNDFPADFAVAKSFLPFTPSIIINSGYGMHGYCLYSEPIEITDENRTQAKERNKKFIVEIRKRAGEYSKAVDGTSDLARILRVPGTFNYKLGKENAPMCHIIENSGLRFSTADIDERLTPPAQKPTSKSQSNEPKNYQSTDPARARRMLDVIPCHLLSYEDWIGVGIILKNNGNTLADWEQWSRGDDRFKNGECEYKWRSFKDGGDLTIASLYRLAQHYGGYSESNAPMDADHKATTRQFVPDCPVDLKIPDEFTFDDDGICFVSKKKKSVNYIPVTANPIVVTKIFCENATFTTKYEVAIKARGKWQRVTYDGRTLQDKSRVIDLADKGALIEDAPRLAKFFARFIKANEFALDETKIFTKPGWQDDDTFVYPSGGENYICRRNGIDYEDLFSSHGDSEQWKQKFREVIGNGGQGSLKRGVIGAALAAPLLKVIGVPNFCVHVEGKYSCGKTPLTKFALSIFGNPAEGKLLRSWDSSAKNRTTMAAGFCDFPQGLDELETLGKRGEEELAKNFYDYTQGVVNQTNKRNGDVKVAESFRGVRLSTGERPALKQNDKGGAYKRTLSFRAKEPLFDNSFARNLHIFCGKNHGHFGHSWVDYICAHKDELTNDFNRILKALDRSTRINSKIYETTHICAVAACETAFYHFRRALSMDDKFELEAAVFDAQKLIADLPTLDDISDTKRGVDLLASWVAEHPKNFIAYGEQSDSVISAQSFSETSGILFADGRVGFFPNALRRIVEDELKLSSCQKLINELFDENKLDTTARDKKRCIRIGGVPRKVYLFKADVLIPNDSEDLAKVA